VKVKWSEPSGAGVFEFAKAKEVNMYGGLLDMKGRPATGSVIELTNLISTKTASARVVSLPPSKTSEVLGVAVELLTPSKTFWGVTFPAEDSDRRPAETGKRHQVGWDGSSRAS
jgi:hypothetical protein